MFPDQLEVSGHFAKGGRFANKLTETGRRRQTPYVRDRRDWTDYCAEIKIP